MLGVGLFNIYMLIRIRFGQYFQPYFEIQCEIAFFYLKSASTIHLSSSDLLALLLARCYPAPARIPLAFQYPLKLRVSSFNQTIRFF